MVRKGFQKPKAGLDYLKSLNYDKYLRKLGFGKEDHYFWKQPMPKEEKELAHLYHRIDYPYPGDKEAMDEFIAQGKMVGTTIGPKGIIGTDNDSTNYPMKMWIRMRNEVIQELQEKGYDVE
ncbi:hypothetical protein K2173_003382 [Erythroxylum novogranatense]|uniref:Uncharacterized protein n=1 Tax=Erythroxylum novogranatense TaxID=1862640 RepID=A0AAV8S8X5_9ROSI|nr:hypothetical protein K2173_003382 [Erythroxylum novogranatense]